MIVANWHNFFEYFNLWPFGIRFAVINKDEKTLWQIKMPYYI